VRDKSNKHYCTIAEIREHVVKIKPPVLIWPVPATDKKQRKREWLPDGWMWGIALKIEALAQDHPKWMECGWVEVRQARGKHYPDQAKPMSLESAYKLVASLPGYSFNGVIRAVEIRSPDYNKVDDPMIEYRERVNKRRT